MYKLVPGGGGNTDKKHFGEERVYLAYISLSHTQPTIVTKAVNRHKGRNYEGMQLIMGFFNCFSLEPRPTCPKGGTAHSGLPLPHENIP